MLQTLLEADPRATNVVVRDFNLHHELWGGENARNDPRVEQLITLLTERQLQLILPPRTVTREEGGHWTTVDLVAVSPELEDFITGCGVQHHLCYNLDHLLIGTMLDIDYTVAVVKPRRA